MSRGDAVLSFLVVSVMTTVVCSGCTGVRQAHLQQSQLRTQQMYLQNRHLAAERAGVQQSLGAIAAEKARLEQENLALRGNQSLLEQRLQNMLSANGQLEDKYRTMLTSDGSSPLNDGQTRLLEELRRKYPEFEFDPETGVSKFSTDLLFASGSDEITPRSMQILQEFAQIMNEGEAQQLKVLVVGHTDDQPIGRPATRQEHATNWHLSTDRASAVVLALKKAGIAEARMGAAGYGMFQPVAGNSTEIERQQNRRVEIFVLAPDQSVAGNAMGDDSLNFK
jgi:chemotaxis protein MotB